MNRRPHNNRPGYVTSRRNPWTPDFVVLHRHGDLWMLWCGEHDTKHFPTSEKEGRALLKVPEHWCEKCAAERARLIERARRGR